MDSNEKPVVISDILSKTFSDIKILNYEAKRVVASEKDFFTKFKHHEPMVFEILKKLPVYCRIEMPISDRFDMFIGLPINFTI